MDSFLAQVISSPEVLWLYAEELFRSPAEKKTEQQTDYRTGWKHNLLGVGKIWLNLFPINMKTQYFWVLNSQIIHLSI